jgi:hypothetical protein
MPKLFSFKELSMELKVSLCMKNTLLLYKISTPLGKEGKEENVGKKHAQREKNFEREG